MGAYYNENNAFAASWLRELIKANVIAQGDVDERSIEDVLPSDLEGYKQCHFFAGIGVWSYALRQAGWSDDREVWTGSCPCQPFSAAGQRKGASDERHLWPSYFHLIEKHRPRVVFGEQVASKDGLTWLDLVQTDLEGANYSVRAADICAAGFGAPHIRQRLYFVGDTLNSRLQGQRRSFKESISEGREGAQRHSSASSIFGELADTECASRKQRRSAVEPSEGFGKKSTRTSIEFGRRSDVSGLAHANGGNTGTEGLQRSGEHGQRTEDSSFGSALDYATNARYNDEGQCDGGPSPCATRSEQSSSISGFWSNCDWIPCIDGKERPVEPGTFPLAHGVANRVGLLRGYGNAIVAPQAQAFIEAYSETIND